MNLHDGQVHCVLAPDRTYDLIEAYPRRPHLAFLKLKTDRDLVSFVQTWGPLDLVRGRRRDELQQGVSVKPVKEYWLFQQWLKTLVRLLGAFKRSRHERKFLLEFLAADFESEQASPIAAPGDPSSLGLILKAFFSLKEDPVGWIEQADLKSVRKAVAFVLDSTPLVTGASLQAIWKGRRPEIRTRWNVDTLLDALRWMVWHDEWIHHPLLFCQACDEPFRPQFSHRRLYCSPACGHRVAARKWRTADLEKKKRRKHR